MAKYITADHAVIAAEIDGDVLTIPVDPANRHYRRHILAAGIVPAAYEPPSAPVPATITPRHLILGLLGDGHITAADAEAWSQGTLPTAIETAVAALPPAAALDARLSLRALADIRRGGPVATAIAAAFALDAAALDEGFRRWSAL